MDQVQERLDALADALGRSLTLDGPEGALLAHSIRGDDSDTARVTSILRRSVAADVHAWQLRHVDTTRESLQQVPANPDLQLSARACVPVRGDGSCLALLWAVDDGEAWPPAHLDVVRRGVTDLAHLLVGRRPGSRGGHRRVRVVARADDSSVVTVGTERELAAALAAVPPGIGVGISAAATAGDQATHELAGQALTAARLAADDPAVGSPASWEELGLYVGLGRSAAGHDPLAPLDEAPSSVMLLETLETFLDLAGDARATAERLRLHRSSLYYRLERVTAALDRDLGDGLVRLDLHLALKRRRWARAQGGG